MKKIKLLFLSILSGLLLAYSWAPHGIPFLIFFAFLPFFFISEAIEKEDSRHVFWKSIGYTYPGLLLWNALTTWWIWNSTPEGSIATFILNSFFMSLNFGIWQWIKKQKPATSLIPISFTALWMSWEYLHLNWEITWPWLNLGNVFGSCTEWVQWYEYTGTFGGTLWVLAINFLLFYLIKSLTNKHLTSIITIASTTIVLLIGPMIFSIIRYNTYESSKENPMEAIIVQQNTDPWVEEYTLTNTEHTVRLLQLAVPLVTESSKLIVCSESSIPHSLEEIKLLNKTYQTDSHKYHGFTYLDSIIKYYPQLNFILGLSTCKYYDTKETETARETPNGQTYIDFFNTSALYSSKGCEQMYHKSKLVPGVEKMPYPKIFVFLEKLAINLGGASGSLGIDSTQKTFEVTTANGIVKIGCPVCYESAYGEHVGEFVRNGAQLLAVITNDAWWGNTPGHVQHFLFSKLRAVETRRTIIRAANTGTSAFIDEKGDEYQMTKYGTRTAIKQNVCPNSAITFYVKHGDYLARIATIIASISFIFGIFLRIRRKKRQID